MRKTILSLLAVAVAAACHAPAAPTSPPAAEEDESDAAAPSGETLEAHLGERLPGVRAISLVKVLRWTERAPGPCTADFAVGEGATRLDLEYETDDGRRSFQEASLDAFGADGWTPSYRTPNGVGFEKLASFRALDLTLRQTLECRCFGKERTVARFPTVLRFRWSEGKRPEVSAALEEKDGLRGLEPSLTAGRLVTYAFSVSGRSPEGGGRCDGHLAVTALVDPAIR